jgi:hypothetical protein
MSSIGSFVHVAHQVLSDPAIEFLATTVLTIVLTQRSRNQKKNDILKVFFYYNQKFFPQKPLLLKLVTCYP